MRNRYWFLTPDKTELIQFQQDRFIHNWRKVINKNNEYPRFEAVIEKFSDEARSLDSYFLDKGWGPITPTQCEVTYVNQMSLLDENGQERPRSFHAYPNACQTGLRCLRQAGALIGILVFLVIFSIPILAFWIPSPAKAGFARSAEVINIFNISYTEPIGFFQSIVEIAQRQMHPLFAVSQCLGKCFNLIKMDISTTVPAIFIVDESCSDFLYVRGRFAFVQVNEFNRVFGVHKSVSETKFEGAHSDFRSMCRDEFGVSESNCLGNLASLTNTNNNQSSSYDSENDGKGGDYRISDFDLAPKLIMPFIIFFVGLRRSRDAEGTRARVSSCDVVRRIWLWNVDSITTTSEPTVPYKRAPRAARRKRDSRQ
jgi:hypothetical protein